MTFLQVLNSILILSLVVLLIRYLWDVVFLRIFQPVLWKQAVKEGKVTPQLVRLERRYPDKVRFFTWWLQVDRLARENIPGAFAELGVYKGKSAKILHAMDPSRKLYLFDTFKGFPAADLRKETGEAATYTENNFSDTDLRKVKKFLGEHENIHFFPGYFPDSASGAEDEQFALVNMDADLLNPTRAGLEFFYPRLSPGGVILIHDYNHKWEGILKAVNEFSESITEVPAIIPDREGTILIIKNKKK